MSEFTAADIDQFINSSSNIDYKPYEEFYKHLHSNPELSHKEWATAKTVASKLRDIAGCEVHENIGTTGVAAVLRNGSGKTVLLRSELDALPVLEKTGLAYSSKVTEKPIMHACGHDMHMTCLMAAVYTLAASRNQWSGTLVIIFQPAEELGNGAQTMVDGGLYDKVPVPDVLLAQHVVANRVGTLGMRVGTMMASSNSLKVTFHGRGGHASMPDRTIDPVIMAASTAVRLQTIVSRQISPSEEFAVVTVGSLNAGDTANIIPAKAEMQINIRTAAEETRGKVLRSIERIVRAESNASGAEQDPVLDTIAKFPITENDKTTTEKLQGTFQSLFSQGFNPNWPRSNASEDFTDLGKAVGKPCCFWFFGGVDSKTWDTAKEKGRMAEDIPVNHSPFFAPTIQPTMKTGTEAMVAGALTFLSKR